MIKLKINHIEIQAEQGLTILDAACKLGFNIPVMCHHHEVDHFNSCMICLVKNKQNGRLIPACSTPVQEGMDILTRDDEITEARKTGLELLLSDHVGDCEAPCTLACPAHMNIPAMNRLLATGQYDQALRIVKQNIALPAVLGYICPAPCEGACRRKPMGGAVSVCLLKRFAGETGLYTEKPVSLSGRRVAVIGSGPAGLSAAYFLQMAGVQAVVYEKAGQAGGQLRSEIAADVLPRSVLDREIQAIEALGVQFKLNTDISKVKFEQLQHDYDAVIIASGLLSETQKLWGIITHTKGLEAHEETYLTSLPGVFAVGSALRPSKLAIRSLAQGKEAAAAIRQMLNNKTMVGQPLAFNSKFGKLVIPEYAQYLKESVGGERHEPEGEKLSGLEASQVQAEAARCLHCDCRKIDRCKLREYSGQYGAVQKRFAFEDRKPVRKYFHQTIVYEPEKCIKCGICVRLTEKYGEPFGFTYIGRGFDVEIGVPFNESIDQGLKRVAERVAEACPTGALGLK